MTASRTELIFNHIKQIGAFPFPSEHLINFNSERLVLSLDVCYCKEKNKWFRGIILTFRSIFEPPVVEINLTHENIIDGKYKICDWFPTATSTLLVDIYLTVVEVFRRKKEDAMLATAIIFDQRESSEEYVPRELWSKFLDNIEVGDW